MSIDTLSTLSIDEPSYKFRLCKNYINLRLPCFFPRYKRAKQIASEGKVSILQLANTRNIFIVENGRGDKFAVITSRKFRNAYCTCKDFQLRSVVGSQRRPANTYWHR